MWDRSCPAVMSGDGWRRRFPCYRSGMKRKGSKTSLVFQHRLRAGVVSRMKISPLDLVERESFSTRRAGGSLFTAATPKWGEPFERSKVPTKYEAWYGWPFKVGCRPNSLLCRSDHHPLDEWEISVSAMYIKCSLWTKTEFLHDKSDPRSSKTLKMCSVAI